MTDASPRPRASLRNALKLLPPASRRMLTGSVVAGLAAGGASAGLLTFINAALVKGQAANPAAAVAGFIGLCLLSLTAGVASEILALRLTQRSLHDLRLWLSRRILRAPLQKLASHGLHRLTAALTDDVASVAHAHQALPVVFIEGSVALGALIYVGTLSGALLLLLLFLLGLGLGVFFLAQRRSLRWMRLAREADDALFGNFRALTEGCKELKMDARRRAAFLEDELGVSADLLRTRNTAGFTIFILGAHASQILIYAAIGLVLFAPQFLANAGADAATGWTLAILFIMGPIMAIANSLPVLGQGFVALRNLEALGVSLPQEPATDAGPPLALKRPGVLEFAGVKHRYRAADGEQGFVLGPLDVRFEPGELVFIIGGNGDGKTTMALLLLGLLYPESGEIRLNGETIGEDERDAYRQNFAAVFADAFVFDSLLGYDDPQSVAQARKLIVELDLNHKLSLEDGRFTTTDLSRGQRKRLALLAAYIEDRPFYVFDEWAAEQDPVFREIFYKDMLPRLKARGKTIIVITHDDRHYHLADRLLRLEAGKIEPLPSSWAAPASDDRQSPAGTMRKTASQTRPAAR
ncbi:cyclic peptide export ABC transporter [Methylocapsa palsarum]|uniref:Putative ATP-binding cassette transporter n=1 Tax=Methylocapsa palsarum TaxID=1612308 RepID=A0A1I4AP97_9HYPH|nr:cyclic peptide export ABC transporter [Methylocapsa palsarum]SFK58305.1 putative ATP-binding cassette transporter [Methylocapsa palsarum]